MIRRLKLLKEGKLEDAKVYVNDLDILHLIIQIKSSVNNNIEKKFNYHSWREKVIVNIRVDHKTADISKMERSSQKLEVFINDIMEKYPVQEYLKIKTCNRAEIYLVLGRMFH